MTDSQIRFHTLVENRRHNQVSEQLDQYKTDVNALTSRYSADKSAETQKYVSDQNARVQRETSRISAGATVSAANVKAAASKYASDQSAASARYTASTKANTDKLRLAFERENAKVVNDLNEKKLLVERLRSAYQNRNTVAQTQKLVAETKATMEQMRINAERLGLDQEAARYNNALTQVRKYETIAKTVKAGAETLNLLESFFDALMRIGDGINYPVRDDQFH